MQNYNFLQKFLHNIYFNYSYVKKISFELEKSIFFDKKFNIKNNYHVFIFGLPRSGTTILLNYLFKSSEFASLKYSDMPFILSPNLSNLLFSRISHKYIDRAHNDRIKINKDSPEAFEEVFWNSINESQSNNFYKYVSIILKKNNSLRYLSKNNSNYKRINKLKNIFPNCKIIILYREPLDHSNSLLMQHIKFNKINKNEKFVLKYMNYLFHNEFGPGYKSWNKSIDYINNLDLNHWLEQWYLFYKDLINYSKDQNIIFINYEEFCKNINLQNKLLKILKINNINKDNYFNLINKKIDTIYDPNLLEKCINLHSKIEKLESNLKFNLLY